MNPEPASPKRRHILSSINPQQSSDKEQREATTPRDDVKPAASADGDDANADATRPRRSRLRLKGEKKRRHRSRSDERDAEAGRHRHHHHHRHRHRRRRERSPTPPNPYDPPPLDPDAAFRESLFDAMADDEGAAYWEGVYGQPIHVYSDEKVGPMGELEKMTDEEYAAYVRQKMWEKTNAGLLEERARREEERKRKKEEEQQRSKEERKNRKLRDEMEASLRRAEERRRSRRWVDAWDAYTKAWAAWDGSLEKLAWPVLSGQRKDVTEEAVREFFLHGIGLEKVGEQQFAAKLKEERVRWHPDKVQQRLGGQGDSDVLKDVTAIFQIVDKLWGQKRNKT
ncbi:hypothetical protein MKX07_000877 [Trichoderma sp. CBMAI-0711]|uniref:J domain-containing protein n=1 Tax=Trichoderma parareesei TaxID=858221 RepID=A0A2H2ZQ25_TRIPA|nr:hypothetical protein MKX07_000877 [Trichoderma sp. CBMAI-0711]OTA05270.1 hypothetical protein A9Z42_0059300 [Trichoderma parareesei]